MMMNGSEITRENCLDVIASLLRYVGPWQKNGEDNFFADYETKEGKCRIHISYHDETPRYNPHQRMVVTLSIGDFSRKWAMFYIPIGAYIGGENVELEEDFTKAKNLFLLIKRLAEQNQHQLS